MKTLDATPIELLIAAGAASAGNLDGLLGETVEELRKNGVPDEDIMGALEVGRAVRERPATAMRETVDVLLGTDLTRRSPEAGCPAQAMPDEDALRSMMLIATGSAMTANCAPCLEKAVSALVGLGVDDGDIRRAVEIGLEVRDRAGRRADDVLNRLAAAA